MGSRGAYPCDMMGGAFGGPHQLAPIMRWPPRCVLGVRLSLDPYRTLSFYCLRNPPIRQDETSRSERQRPCLRPAFA